MANYRLVYSSDERFQTVLMAIRAIDKKNKSTKRKRVKVSNITSSMNSTLNSFEEGVSKKIEEFKKRRDILCMK